MIVAEDQSVHRPCTTAGLGALQALYDLEEFSRFKLKGRGDRELRTRKATPCGARDRQSGTRRHLPAGQAYPEVKVPQLALDFIESQA